MGSTQKRSLVLNASRGFTLIELLVVIAIIGLLASIILASLNSARAKSRDAKRIAEMKSLQNALELYANDNSGTYPNANTAGGTDIASALSTLAPSYISVLPINPGSGGGAYYYLSNATSNSTTYCVGVALEGVAPVPSTTCQAGINLIGSHGITYAIGN